MRPWLPPILKAKRPHPCRPQVWLANPADYFGRFPDADLLVSSDALDTQLEPGDTGLELPHAAYTAMNIGAPSRSSTSPMLHACLCAGTASDLEKLERIARYAACKKPF